MGCLGQLTELVYLILCICKSILRFKIEPGITYFLVKCYEPLRSLQNLYFAALEQRGLEMTEEGDKGLSLITYSVQPYKGVLGSTEPKSDRFVDLISDDIGNSASFHVVMLIIIKRYSV